MRYQKFILVLATVVTFSGLSPLWAGCWACEQIGTSPVTCASKFLSGGTSCELKCSDRLGGSYCICKTSGICEGGRGCDGPCPNSEVQDDAALSRPEIHSATVRQAFEVEREQELAAMRPIVRFPEPLLAGIGETHPLAASILDSLTSNGRLAAGEFKGLLSITPSDGSEGLVEVYSFEAHVTPVPGAESYSIVIQLADHPDVKRIVGTISMQDGPSEVRIHGNRGGEEIFQHH